MKIAICDDLPEERAALRQSLSAFLSQAGMEAEITEYSGGEALLEDFSADKFSLIFLDIYMDGISGVETARRLREKDPACLIVFTTTSLEHGADAFDVDAFHYLVKPIAQEKLFTVLRRWQSLLSELQTVTLKSGRGNIRILVRDILYIEVHGRACTVHTRSGPVQASMTLSALEALLPADQFIKPIRYCIAALQYIRHIDQTYLELEDGTQLPFARGERDNLRQVLSAYRLRQLRRR